MRVLSKHAHILQLSTAMFLHTLHGVTVLCPSTPDLACVPAASSAANFTT
jgi:hypothetical protein